MTPANSASPELSAVLAWVDDKCFIACSPSITTPPEVNFLVRGHPAQSVSVYVSLPLTHCLPNLYTIRALLKYLQKRFKAFHACAVGFAMYLQISLHANCASMRSAAR